MHEKLEEIVNFIMRDEPESPACRDCEAMLHTYIDAELDGQDAPARFPDVGTHLEACAECRQAYQELRELLQMERENTLESPPIAASFDLAYLEDSRRDIWEAMERMGKRVMRLVAAVQIRIERPGVFFDQLPPPLTPQPLALVTRGEGDEAAAHLLSLPTHEHDLTFELTIGPVAGDKIVLALRVREISSGRPLSRMRVTLRDSEHRVLIGELTDANGQAVFPLLGSGSFIVQGHHGEWTWEMPIRVRLRGEAT